MPLVVVADAAGCCYIFMFNLYLQAVSSYCVDIVKMVVLLLLWMLLFSCMLAKFISPLTSGSSSRTNIYLHAYMCVCTALAEGCTGSRFFLSLALLCLCLCMLFASCCNLNGNVIRGISAEPKLSSGGNKGLFGLVVGRVKLAFIPI